jgi:ribosomal protein S24E
MKVNIVSEEYNLLLKRREVVFRVEHSEIGGTPNRLEIRSKLATLMKKDPALIFIKKMETKRGTMTVVGEANAYDSIEQATRVEPKHIIARNTPPKKTEAAETA